MDSIPRFKLRTRNDGLYLTLPEPVPDFLVPVMKAMNPALDSRVFAMIGTGAAGMAAAETLRQDGYQGRIVMVTREQDPPTIGPILAKCILLILMRMSPSYVQAVSIENTGSR